MPQDFFRVALCFRDRSYFKLMNVPSALEIAIHLNPLSYGVDGLRGALTHGSMFGFRIDFAVLGILAAIVVWLGSYLFSKIQL